jgi:hypothetical protein
MSSRCLEGFAFSPLYGILGDGSLTVESEGNLYDFISKGSETNWEMFGLLEFVRLDYCSMDTMNNFFDRLSEHFYEMNIGEPSHPARHSEHNPDEISSVGEEGESELFQRQRDR